MFFTILKIARTFGRPGHAGRGVLGLAPDHATCRIGFANGGAERAVPIVREPSQPLFWLAISGVALFVRRSGFCYGLQNAATSVSLNRMLADFSPSILGTVAARIKMVAVSKMRKSEDRCEKHF